jgi:hypothetical protein
LRSKALDRREANRGLTTPGAGGHADAMEAAPSEGESAMKLGTLGTILVLVLLTAASVEAQWDSPQIRASLAGVRTLVNGVERGRFRMAAGTLWTHHGVK